MRKPGGDCCTVSLKTTEEDEEEIKEASASLAATKLIKIVVLSQHIKRKKTSFFLEKMFLVHWLWQEFSSETPILCRLSHQQEAFEPTHTNTVRYSISIKQPGDNNEVWEYEYSDTVLKAAHTATIHSLNKSAGKKNSTTMLEIDQWREVCVSTQKIMGVGILMCAEGR